MGNPPAGWSEWVIRDLAPKRGLAGGPFGSSLGTKDYVRMGVPVIRGQNLSSDGKFDGSEFVYVSEGKADELKRNIAIPGDLVFTQRGTLGQVGVVPANDFERYVISQSQMRLRPDPEVADVDFLYYVFRSPQMLDMIDSRAIVTGVPHINLGILGDFQVLLPPLSEQRAIAAVLGALDDKIESNRRVVKTARELIDALFCTAFSDGEINVQVSSLAEVVDCLHTKKPDQALEGKQLLQLSNISDDGFLILGNHYPISLDDYTKWTANIEASEGDVILTNVGRVGALARLPKGVKAALGRNMTAIRARKPSDALFIFAALNNAQVRRGMKSLIDVGTIMDALNVHAIRRILLPESTVPQRDDFASAIGAVVGRAEVAVKESSGLESLRDALLPELLSGRLRVKDAESMMENV